jgi:hypothetical protein
MTTRYPGVSFQPHLSQKPWKAYYRRHGQYITVGYYPTAEEASQARQEALARYREPVSGGWVENLLEDLSPSSHELDA